jgi:hypothetical protein
MAGMDIRTIAELMGHKRIQMTMRYAHLAPAHNLAAIERLPERQLTPELAMTLRGPLPTLWPSLTKFILLC